MGTSFSGAGAAGTIAESGAAQPQAPVDAKQSTGSAATRTRERPQS
jgi:hypothetical protein